MLTNYERNLRNFKEILRFIEEKKELLIPKWLFDETKSVVMILPFVHRNEIFTQKFSKYFINF